MIFKFKTSTESDCQREDYSRGSAVGKGPSPPDVITCTCLIICDEGRLKKRYTSYRLDFADYISPLKKTEATTALNYVKSKNV